jgi:hypothetical protein
LNIYSYFVSFSNSFWLNVSSNFLFYFFKSSIYISFYSFYKSNDILSSSIWEFLKSKSISLFKHEPMWPLQMGQILQCWFPQIKSFSFIFGVVTEIEDEHLKKIQVSMFYNIGKSTINKLWQSWNARYLIVWTFGRDRVEKWVKANPPIPII